MSKSVPLVLFCFLCFQETAFQEFYELGKRAADKVVSCDKRKEKFECQHECCKREEHIRNILTEESKADSVRRGQ